MRHDEEETRNQPGQLESLERLGVTALRAGDNGPAEQLFRKALELSASAPELHNNLGLALKNQGKFLEAATCLARAVELNPASAPMHNNLGTVLERLGRLDEAAAAYQKALAIDPTYAIAAFNLGCACSAHGDRQAAAEHYRQATRLRPEFSQAWSALGNVLLLLGSLEEARTALDRAIALDPENSQLHRALGDVFHQQKQLHQAVGSYERAVSLDAGSVDAWYGMGCAQLAMGEHAAAIGSYERCLRWVPNSAEVHYNLGVAQFRLGGTEQALEHLRRAEVLNPELLGKSARETIAVIIPGSPSADHQAILDARRVWSEQCVLRQPNPPLRDRIAGARIRVGYLSAFFHRANWMKPVWGLINRHDRGRFEIHLFSERERSCFESGYQPHITDRVHHLGGLPNEQAAELIRACELYILVDLNGYSYMARLPLLGFKPAPIVVAWFNMFATSGLDSVDYLIGDDVVIPPEEERFYTEKVLRVPGTYLAFEVNHPVPEIAPPPCLSSGAITFGSLASQYKITPQVLAAWCGILKQSPGSRIVLKNADLGSAMNRSYVYEQFAAHGIEPDRVELSGPAGHFQFLEKYSEIDLGLDTYPYNGGTTTMEAIWQGVPILTFVGDRWASRTSASLLRAGNLDAFVAGSAEGFVQRAVELARDRDTPARLRELRSNLRDQLKCSAVCDTAALTRAVEHHYTALCRRP